jgi:hypothetical protein
VRPGHRGLGSPARSTTTAIADALATPSLPGHVSPCECGELDRMVAVRGPQELVPILQRAGAVWEPKAVALPDQVAHDRSPEDRA